MSNAEDARLDIDRLVDLGKLVLNACQQVWVAVHEKPVECLIVTVSVKTTDGTSTHALINRDALEEGERPSEALIDEVTRAVDEYAHSLPNVGLEVNELPS